MSDIFSPIAFVILMIMTFPYGWPVLALWLFVGCYMVAITETRGPLADFLFIFSGPISLIYEIGRRK